MSGHTTQSNSDANDAPLPNQSFFSWLKSQTALFISQFLGLAGVIYVLAAVPYYLKPIKDIPEIFNPKNIQDFVIYAHIPFLLLFIVSLLNILNYNASGSYRSRIVYERIFNKKLGGAQLRKGRIQLKKFKMCFLCFWILMLVLYSSFIFQINSQATGKSLENLQTTGKEGNLNIGELRKIDNAKIQEIDEELPKIVGKIMGGSWSIKQKVKISSSWSDALSYIKFEFFVFAANNLSVLCIFWCFTILAFPWHTKKHTIKARIVRNTGTIIIVIITALFPAFLFLSQIDGVYYEEHIKTYTILADAVSGLINAIILAIFIARLDSKLIGLPSYLISVLYGYSAIQPLFVVFEQPGEISQILKAFVFIVVFVFKIYFFLIITYAMQTGRMLDYLVCFPKLFGRVDSIFANQFQIEIHEEEAGFKFLIKNKNVLVYSGSQHFKTKEECKTGIEEVREKMKKRDYYETKESFGTHTIEVFRDKDKTFKVCSSVDIRSHDEANDLKTESIVNIPHCKVILN